MEPGGIFIVIPAYNEAPQVVAEAVRKLRAVPGGAQWQVVVVDDGSQPPLEKCALGDDGAVTVLRHEINRGQGAALQTGMEFAVRCGAAVCVHFDADGQHDASDVPALLAALDSGCDVALGSRFMRPADIAAIPPQRRLLLRIARIVNGLLTGLWLSDAHNGFRALNRNALAKIQLTEDRMAHASQILAQIRGSRLRWMEVPTHVAYSAYSVAKGQRCGNAVNILVDLLLNKLMR